MVSSPVGGGGSAGEQQRRDRSAASGGGQVGPGQVCDWLYLRSSNVGSPCRLERFGSAR
jgi:hypothetical protein